MLQDRGDQWGFLASLATEDTMETRGTLGRREPEGLGGLLVSGGVKERGVPVAFLVFLGSKVNLAPKELRET